MPSLAQFSTPHRELSILPARLARFSARVRAMDLSRWSMTAHSLLRRLAIDVDEREFADTIELTENV